MLIVISPAKTLDFSCDTRLDRASNPDFIQEASMLIQKLRTMTPKKLGKLMDISDNLAQLNFERFAKWDEDHLTSEVRPALLAFKGDVYQGMEAQNFSDEDIDFAQAHLRILSGLYGLLRPMDMIQPYRLEMGTKLAVGRTKDLYQYWKGKIAPRINEAISQQGGDWLINLASEEYFSAVDTKAIHAKVIKPVFLDGKNGKYKVISFWAKKARGMMTAFIIQNRIQDVNLLKQFSGGGYAYCGELSSEMEWVFKREEQLPVL